MAVIVSLDETHHPICHLILFGGNGRCTCGEEDRRNKVKKKTKKPDIKNRRVSKQG